MHLLLLLVSCIDLHIWMQLILAAPIIKPFLKTEGILELRSLWSACHHSLYPSPSLSSRCHLSLSQSSHVPSPSRHLLLTLPSASLCRHRSICVISVACICSAVFFAVCMVMAGVCRGDANKVMWVSLRLWLRSGLGPRLPLFCFGLVCFIGGLYL